MCSRGSNWGLPLIKTGGVPAETLSMSPELHAVVKDKPEALYLTEEGFAPAGVLITAVGELDLATVGALRDRLCAAAEAGVERVVLDLRGVSFMDSVALAAIVRAEKALGAGGRVAVVIDADSYAMLIFEIAGLPSALELVESREEAVAHVGGHAA